MNNHEVVKCWLDHKKDQGKSKTIFFEGPDIYSYGHHFKMGTLVSPSKVIISTRKYSRTTSKHQSIVRSLIDQKGLEKEFVSTLD
jgi:hypothetical protein